MLLPAQKDLAGVEFRPLAASSIPLALEVYLLAHRDELVHPDISKDLYIQPGGIGT